jgi:hypothetical protein
VKPLKMRRYDQVDLSKEFQIRQQRREDQKKKMLKELYEKHDERVTQLKTKALPSDKAAENKEGSDTDALTDGEQQIKRKMAL